MRIHRAPPRRRPRQAFFLLLALVLSPFGNHAGDDPAPSSGNPAIPLQSLASTRKEADQPTPESRVRVRGIVTAHAAGGLLFLQDGPEVIRVRLADASAEVLAASPSVTFKIGQSVEVAGLLMPQGDDWLLDEATAEPIPSIGPPIEPRRLEAGGAYVAAEVHERLVEISAQIRGNIFLSQRTQIFVTHGESLAHVALPAPLPALLRNQLETGAEVSLTGLYFSEHGEIGLGDDFFLLLRSPDDIRVLRQAPFWNARRLGNLLILLTLAAVMVLLWVLALRRRVRRQTQQIRQRIERETHLETRARQIFDNISDSIFTVDLEARFVSVNAAATQLTGYPAERMVGSGPDLILRPRDARRARLYVRRMLNRDNVTVFQHPLTRQDGTRLWVETATRFVRNADGAVEVFGVTRDITERRNSLKVLRQARDAANAASRAKSNFLENVSHEIRTPLNGILGTLDLLHGTPLDPEQKDLLSTSRSCADTLMALLNDILDLSKIETGRMDLALRPFRLPLLAHQAVEMIRFPARAKGIQLHLEVAPDLPPERVGDAPRLQQVLLNLLDNAVKFTPQGSITFSVQAGPENWPGAVAFRISDTGIGIDPAVQAHLFEPFVQGDSSTTRSHGGVGLGLALAQRIVAVMGGTIDFTSTPGEGSTFTVLVPLPPSTQTATEEPSETLSEPGWASLDEGEDAPKFLLFQRQRTPENPIAAELNSLGLSPAIASDHETLWAQFEEGAGLILVDGLSNAAYCLPLLAEMREQGILPQPWVVVLTNAIAPEERESLIESGYDDVVVKDARTQILRQAISRGLAAKRAHPKHLE